MNLRHFLKITVLIIWGIFNSVIIHSAGPLQEIVVKEGDTLWSIANYYLKDPKRWPEILKYNNLPLTDPAVALPGMKLKVPVLLIKEHLRKADLIYLNVPVLYRRKNQPTWKEAYLDLDLYNDDGLRTMDNAEAHVRFYSGDVLKLHKNSLVILRPELKKEEVNLLTGTLRAGRTKVITETAEVTPQTSGTLYKARIRDDKSTIVQVEKGSTEVLGLDTGKKVVVPEGYANITMPHKSPTKPVKVPKMSGYEMVEFNEKGEPILIETNSQEKKVRETKTKPAQALPKKQGKSIAMYRVQVAQESSFSRVIWDKKRELTDKTDVNSTEGYDLPDGKYYRRVSYIEPSGEESEFSLLPPFEADNRPPTLSVSLPKDGFRTRETMIPVEGQVELGSIVTVNNLPVKIEPDGKFRWSVVLNKSGANIIKIIGKDLTGNKTEIQRTVYLLGKSR